YIDVRTLFGHDLLGRALKIAVRLRLTPHHLHRVHQILLLVVVSVTERGRPGKILVIFPSTDGNAVNALTLGSQGCWSTACARASPFNSGCACTHRSASTTSSGKVAAANICA